MISLLTFPDISYTGMKIALVESSPEIQQLVTKYLDSLKLSTNVVLYDLKLQAEQLDYTLAVLNSCDLIFYERPKLAHWLTGYVLSLPHCFYLEYDTNTLNTIYKISLRHVDDNSISGVIDNAVQKRSYSAL